MKRKKKCECVIIYLDWGFGHISHRAGNAGSTFSLEVAASSVPVRLFHQRCQSSGKLGSRSAGMNRLPRCYCCSHRSHERSLETTWPGSIPCEGGCLPPLGVRPSFKVHKVTQELRYTHSRTRARAPRHRQISWTFLLSQLIPPSPPHPPPHLTPHPLFSLQSAEIRSMSSVYMIPIQSRAYKITTFQHC